MKIIIIIIIIIYSYMVYLISLDKLQEWVTSAFKIKKQIRINIYPEMVFEFNWKIKLNNKHSYYATLYWQLA